MEFRELTNQEFNQFTNSFKLKSLYQTSEYGFVMNQENYDSLFLGLVDNNIIIAATLVLVEKESGFKYAYAPKGFLLDYENLELLKLFTKEISIYLNKKGIMGIKLNPIIIRNIYDFKTQRIYKNPKYDIIYKELINNGYYHLGYNNYFEALKPRFEAILDLTKTTEQIFKNFKKNYRTKIRSAENNGIKVYKGNIDDLNYLYKFTKNTYDRTLQYFINSYNYFNKRNMIELYYTKLDTKEYLTKIQEKLNYYEQQSSYYNELIINGSFKNKEIFIKKRMKADKQLNYYKDEIINATNLLRTNPEGIITSCALVVKTNNMASILIDGYDKDFKKFNSKHLLIWNIIKEYKNQNVSSLNLGGVSNVVADPGKYTGLNEFKLSFGSLVYEYIGDLELVSNKKNYNLYRNYVPLKKMIINKITK